MDQSGGRPADAVNAGTKTLLNSLSAKTFIYGPKQWMISDYNPVPDTFQLTQPKPSESNPQDDAATTMSPLITPSASSWW